MNIKVKKNHVKYLIIGGGISGCSAAHFLKKKTSDFYLVESENSLGGVINTKIIDGYTLENGPNTILINNEPTISFFKDLGLDKKLIYPNKYVEKKYFLHNKKIVSVPNSLVSLLFTNLISIKEKISFFRNIFFFKRNSFKSVNEFFTRNFGPMFHDNIIEPFLNGIYAGDTSKMSFEYSMPKIYNIYKNYSSFLQYFTNRKIKNIKNSNLPFTIQGGYSQIFKIIHSSLKNNILTNHKVIKIEYDKIYSVKFSNQKIITCDKLILTIKPHLIFKLFNHNFNIAKKLYNPIDVFHFGFMKKYYNSDVKGFGLLSKEKENTSFLGILFTSDIFTHLAPKNYKLFTVLVGGEKQSNLCKLKKTDLLKKVEDEIKELFKIDKISFRNHYRWSEAIPKYNNDTIQILNSEFNKLNIKYKNIFITGNFIDGVSVSDCIKKSYNLIKKF